MKFNIPGRLPGLNEIIDAAKLKGRHYKEYAVMKDTYTNLVAWSAKDLPQFERISLAITWYEPNEKRDPDNVAGGKKFIMDWLVRAGKIPNDTRRYIKSIRHEFETDRRNPRVEVDIEAV
jgi:hypothetical protein